MPTLKKRINITIDDELFDNLKQLAKKENASIASVSHALLERAIELQEDRYFSKIGEERLAKKSKKLSHNEVWD